MTKPILPNYKNLLEIAFHTEKVKSRRLAKTMSISLEQALPIVLLQTLKANQAEKPSQQAMTDLHDLCDLVLKRKADIQKQLEISLAKRELSKQRHQTKKQENAIPDNAWCLWFDGSAKPNPGKCSIGVVLQSPDGRQETISRRIADGDSSDAEYQALIAGLKIAVAMAQSNKMEQLYVIGDSQVILNDVQNLAINSSFLLQEYRLQAHALIQQLTSVVFMWKPRVKNAQADALALLAQQL